MTCTATGDRPLRANHRQRTVRDGEQVMTAEEAICRSGVLDVDNDLRPWPSRDRPAGQAVPERDDGAYPGARLLAEQIESPHANEK